MSIGPGAYENLCKELLTKEGAQAVVILVIGMNMKQLKPGIKEGDVAVNCYASSDVIAQVPRVLRGVATEMEKDLAGGGNGHGFRDAGGS